MEPFYNALHTFDINQVTLNSFTGFDFLKEQYKHHIFARYLFFFYKLLYQCF